MSFTFNVQSVTLNVVHSQNKQRLFPYRLTFETEECLLRGTELQLYILTYSTVQIPS